MLAETLFKLIRNEIFGEEITVEKEKFSTDVLRDLYKLSKSHDVAHLLSDAIIKNGLMDTDCSVYKLFIKQQQLAVSRYERINYELKSLTEIFEKEKIPFMPLKGSVLRKFYPEPWMRTSCDIDILINEENLERATDALVNKYGYEKTIEWDHDVSFMSASGVHLELHYNFIEYKSRDPEMNERIWKDAILSEGYEYRYEMTDVTYYYYHVAHMAKHFESGGCGIRPFIDFAIMKQNIPVDEEQLSLVLSQTKLNEFYNGCLKLYNVWFESGEHDQLTKEMEKFILRAGVYGNIENRVAVIKSTKSQGKFRYLMYKIFLPYELLSVIYPKLKKRRYLTPFYEVRRWFEILFCGRMKNAVREIKVNANTGAEQVQKVSNLMKELGLETAIKIDDK